MTPTRRQVLKWFAKIFDLCALTGSFVISAIAVYSTPQHLTLSRLLNLRITVGNCLLFVLLLLAWHGMFVAAGLYVAKRLTSRRGDFVDTLKATSFASVLLLSAARIFRIGIVKPGFVLVFWVCCICAMTIGRVAARPLLLALRKRSRNSRHLLIVGTNDRAMEFARTVSERPEIGYKVVGFVDDDWEGIQKFEATGHTRCCTFPELPKFLRQNVVDEAAIYLPLRSYYEHATQLVSQCKQHGIAIRFDPHIVSMQSPGDHAHEPDDYSPVFGIHGSNEIWPAVAKRVIDFVVSAAVLLLVSPVIFVVALMVKLSSPGPIFFSQIRVGLNKRQFTMYKFRTMVADAENLQEQLQSMNEMAGPVFKIKNDPRITPFGRFLRRTSVDELPQLLNVIKGDMSLVGPRAMSMRDYQLFQQDWQRRRFSVKPGITCLWQINGRNSIPFDKWMELDMQYIDKWSLLLDLKILARTVPAVLRGTGAA
jgi:exopolysaccharide biosynthesis polyprenyl glycosylphosphotransferase